MPRLIKAKWNALGMFAINWIWRNLNGEEREWIGEREIVFEFHSLYLMPITDSWMNHQIESRSPFTSHHNLRFSEWQPWNSRVCVLVFWLSPETQQVNVCYGLSAHLQRRSRDVRGEQSRRGKFFRKNGINNDFSSAWWGWNWFYQSVRRLLADAGGITSVVFLLFNSNFTFPFFSFWQTQNTWMSGIYLNTLLHDNTKRTVEEGGKVFPLFFGT